MINFTPQDFALFGQMLDRQDFEQCCVSFPDGVERMIVQTPGSDVNCAFTYSEWLALKEAVAGARLLQRVYELANS